MLTFQKQKFYFDITIFKVYLRSLNLWACEQTMFDTHETESKKDGAAWFGQLGL